MSAYVVASWYEIGRGTAVAIVVHVAALVLALGVGWAYAAMFAIAYAVVSVVINLAMEAVIKLVHPKCPGCGGRHAPHDAEGGGGDR